ncbi:hypothetical protein AAFF_G00348250 [Aldrovandia affinis]|uniref:Uncharacterized protein n=1 Tax=Aldrovandia affinis TaxID=143900 RepID=A0AAD7R5V2_9TELE|nr:hypothetical protein AAFF_G00348250 [Aldrovandia affinis]
MIVGTTQLFIEFCVEDRKDVLVNYGKSKFDFSCLGGTDSTKHLNEVDLFGAIDQKGQVCCGIQTIAPSHNKRYD